MEPFGRGFLNSTSTSTSNYNSTSTYSVFTKKNEFGKKIWGKNLWITLSGNTKKGGASRLLPPFQVG